LRPRDRRIRRCWRRLCRRTSRRLAEQITVDLFRLFPCLPFRRDDFLDRVLRGEVVFGWFHADADDKPQLVEITPAFSLAREFAASLSSSGRTPRADSNMALSALREISIACSWLPPTTV
jgi:hypothetical protein